MGPGLNTKEMVVSP